MKITSFVLLLLWLLPLSGYSEDSAPKKLKVMFIGNSLIGAGEIPPIIAAMAKSSGREFEFFTSLIGASCLQQHWEKGEALAKIKSEKWDYVVLQEKATYPKDHREDMNKYVRMFDAEIKKAGAQTVLYMTWPVYNQVPTEIKQEEMAPLQEAYTSLGKELNVGVVPVGPAWLAFMGPGKNPPFQLYRDSHHPTTHGGYLAACVFYRSFFGQPSVGMPHQIVGPKINKKGVLPDLKKEEAERLQKIADETPMEPLNRGGS